MRIIEVTEEPNLMKAFADFLPLAMKELGLTKLPSIELEMRVSDPKQPTFGKFDNKKATIYLGVKNRHPLDVLRTLAHELAHFKQWLEQELGPKSGKTGSPEENDAHVKAGVIMRHFDKAFPHYFDERPIIKESVGNEIVNKLEIIQQEVHDDPSKAGPIKLKLQALSRWVDALLKKHEEPMTPELTESPETDVDSVDAITQKLIQDITQALPASSPEYAAIRSRIEQILIDATKEAHVAGVVAGKKAAVAEGDALTASVKEMLHKFTPIPSDKLVDTYVGIFRRRKIDTEDAIAFLKIAANKEKSIIDMKSLISSGKGKIDDFVDSAQQPVFEKVISDFIEVQPDTSSEVGKGELAFILLGDFTIKLSKGDLMINGKKYEVKSSGPSGTGRSGSVMGASALVTGKVAWPMVKNILEGYGFREFFYPGTKVPRFKLTQKGLADYNKEFDRLGKKLSKKDRAKLLTDMLSVPYKWAVDEISRPMVLSKVESMIDSDGHIDTSYRGDFMKYVGYLAAYMYRQDGEESGKDHFLFFNRYSRSFRVFAATQFEKEILKPNSVFSFVNGVNWNNGQARASPEFYFDTPKQEKK